MTRDSYRLTHRGVAAAELIEITFSGRALSALVGESVAAALAAAGIRNFRTSAKGDPRGVFCGMGVCFECLVRIDGRRSQRACMTKVAPGMRIEPESRTGVEPPGGHAALAKPPHGDLPVEEHQILVVGAGPAGLSAAEAAAGVGAKVTVLDERPQAGGQFFKQLAPSHAFANDAPTDRQYAAGRALINRVQHAGVRVLNAATVWNGSAATDGGAELDVLCDGRAVRHRARQLIIATGAYERPWPIPGWTLPGVMTTGAVQTLMRAYRVAPGDRVLLAGNGPLNLQVACELVRNGIEVVAVAEAARRPGLNRAPAALTALLRSPGLMADGVRYLSRLAYRRVPVLFGHLVVRLEGDGCVERAILAQIDDAGQPVAGSEQSFDVDTVCLGYGFASSSELTRLLGCRHTYSSAPWPALVVDRDAEGATSLPGVLVAGDCGEIRGARVAQAQGILAGLAAARRLGHAGGASTSAANRQAHRKLLRHLAFQRALWTLFEAPPLDHPLADDAYLCRCEGVTAGVVRGLIDSGVTEIGAIKRRTRVGMGPCQGRYCGITVARLCAAAARHGLDERSYFAPRFPVKPVPIAALASEKPEPREQDQGTTAPVPVRQKASPRDEYEADIAIIGAGIIGSCTAYYLAQDGVDVVVLERGQRNGAASGNNAGSLHVQLLAYDFGDWAQAGGGPAAETLGMQRESAALWPDFAATLGVDLDIEITGGLMLAGDEERLQHLRRKAALERRHGIEVEVLSAGELRALAPYVSERMAGAAWCPAEGRINPLLAAPAVLDGAAAAGARIHENTEVNAIERNSSGFELRTANGTFRAGKVLNASGGWSAQVASLVGANLPTRAHPIQLIVTEPVAPVVGHLLAYADRHLTLKQVRNGNLVIGGGWPATLDPDTGLPTVRRDSFEGNLWVAAQVLPALESLHVIRSWAAMNVALDGAPLLGELPGVPGFYNAVTVNGMTLGPVLGRLNAQMLRTGRIPNGLEFFTLARFG